MTYSLDYRKQVLKRPNEGMIFAESATFYDISPTTIQKWKERIHSKTTRYIKHYKRQNEALSQDVKNYSDDYHDERVQRFNCSPTGTGKPLKRIGVSKKKILEHSKVCLIKRAHYLSKLNHFINKGCSIVYMDEMDESGFESEKICPDDYAPMGSPCIDS